MKKILGTLVLVFVLSLSIDAQNALPNKYLVDTVGYSKGLPMSNFIVEFREIYTHNITSEGWTMEVGTVTYTDTTYKYQVINDSIPNRIIFQVDKSTADSTLKAACNPFRQLLYSKFGVDNISEAP